jgi:DNA-binding Lrp family transcriptional regulator
VVVFDFDIRPRHFGIDLCGTVVAGRAAKRVAFAAVTTGPTNLVVLVGCHDVDALDDYTADPLGAIRHVETAPVINFVKCAGVLLPR